MWSKRVNSYKNGKLLSYFRFQTAEKDKSRPTVDDKKEKKVIINFSALYLKRPFGNLVRDIFPSPKLSTKSPPMAIANIPLTHGHGVVVINIATYSQLDSWAKLMLWSIPSQVTFRSPTQAIEAQCSAKRVILPIVCYTHLIYTQ